MPVKILINHDFPGEPVMVSGLFKEGGGGSLISLFGKFVVNGITCIEPSIQVIPFPFYFDVKSRPYAGNWKQVVYAVELHGQFVANSELPINLV